MLITCVHYKQLPSTTSQKLQATTSAYFKKRSKETQWSTGIKRTKTNIALKPKKRMAKQKTQTHIRNLKNHAMRDLRWWHESRLRTQQKSGGRGCGGMNRSIYNDAPISDRKRDYETGDWEEKEKAKKILHNKYEGAQPETAAKDGQIAPAPYLERSFLLLPPAPALPPPPLLQRLRLSASWSWRCPYRSSPGLNFPRYNTVLDGN